MANDGLDQLPVAGDGPVPLRVIGLHVAPLRCQQSELLRCEVLAQDFSDVALVAQQQTLQMPHQLRHHIAFIHVCWRDTHAHDESLRVDEQMATEPIKRAEFGCGTAITSQSGKDFCLGGALEATDRHREAIDTI